MRNGETRIIQFTALSNIHTSGDWLGFILHLEKLVKCNLLGKMSFSVLVKTVEEVKAQS